MKLEIHNLVGKNCMTREDGQKVYDLIYPRLLEGESVELDFDGVVIFASPFFNVAIGQLLRDIDSDTLNKLLKPSHLSPLGLRILKRVIKNSKWYYSSENNQRIVDQVLEEQASCV